MIGTRRERIERRNFMIGLFLPTMSGGWTVSHATNLATYRYQYLRELALMADHFQFDYLFAGGGYMPKITRAFKFRDRMTDALTPTAALGAMTTHPMVISTVHILYRHAPLVLAKLGAGIDEISNGGWGMNVVCGLTPRAAEIFDFPDLGHDARYEAATEFMAIVQQLWSRDEPISYEGRHYRTKEAFLDTKPIQQPWPLLVNAGFSEAGQDFAARLYDYE